MVQWLTLGAFTAGAPGSIPGQGTKIPRAMCMDAKSLQLCPNLCDPMNCSLPDSSVRGILQARTLRVGCQALLQGIFLIQGLNLCFIMSPAMQVSSLPLAPAGKPHKLCGTAKNKNRRHIYIYIYVYTLKNI